MSVEKGNVLFLLAALANQGKGPATNKPQTTQWFDYSGRGNHGTLKNFPETDSSPWVGSGTKNDPHALQFNGTQYVEIASPNIINDMVSGDFTFQAHFYLGAPGTILSTGGNTTDVGFAVVVDDLNNLKLYVRTPTKSAVFDFGRKDTLAWYDVAAAFNSSNGQMWVYLNGAPFGFTTAIDGTFTDTNKTLRLGANNDGTNTGFNGKIASVRAYNRFLSSAEVADNYLSGSLVYKPNKDLPSKVTLPMRAQIPSQIRVGVSGKVTGNYAIEPIGQENFESSIKVFHHSSMEGSITVNPNGWVRGTYAIEGRGLEDLPSSIGVQRHSSLPGSISVNPSTKVTGRYAISERYPEDLPSGLVIRNPDLPGHIKVHKLVETKATGHYSIKTTNLEDLPGSITVKQKSDLPGNIRVLTTGLAVGSYGIEERTAADLPSQIMIRSTKDLPSHIRVPSRGKMTGRYGTETIEISDLPGSINIKGTNDIPSNIKVITSTWMRGQYGMSPVFAEDIPGSIGVKVFNELPASLFITPEGKMTGKYDISGIYLEDLPSSFNIAETSNLPSRLGVTPYTKMSGRYSIEEPPKIVQDLYPVKDAFVRSNVPRLNYGTEQEMLVGRQENELFRSYVGFDINSIPKVNTSVGYAKLKLFFNAYQAGPVKLQIVQPSADWQEKGITWANQPFPNMNGYTGHIAEFEVDSKRGYLEVDVSQFVIDWHEGKSPNTGFAIRLVDETGTNVYKSFATKESIESRPILEVTYYDTNVYSRDWSYLEGSITVAQNVTKDLKGHINIRSYWSESTLGGHIHVLNQDMIEGNIIVSKPDMPTHIEVRKRDWSEMPGSITARGNRVEDLESNIWVNGWQLPGTITVPFRSDLEGEITVVRTEGDDLPGTIWVNGWQLPGDVTVRRDEQNDLPGQLVVNGIYLPGELIVLQPFDVPGSITVRHDDYSEIPGDFEIPQKSDFGGSIWVNGLWFPGEMQVFAKSQLPSHIQVRQFGDSDLVSSIRINGYDGLPSSITVPPKYDMPGELNVLSGYLAGSITVPANGNKDLLSHIGARVRGASDFDIIIGVRSGYLGSHIEVRREGNADLPSNIQVKVPGWSYLPGHANVKVWGEKDVPSSLTVRVDGKYDMKSSFNVRVWGDPSDLPGELVPNVWGAGDLPSETGIRVWSHHDQPSHIAARQKNHSDLVITFGIKEVSELPGEITVRTWGKDELPGHMEIFYKSELPGTISVWNKSNLPGHLYVLHRDDLPGEIEVLTGKAYVFIM